MYFDGSISSSSSGAQSWSQTGVAAAHTAAMASLLGSPTPSATSTAPSSASKRATLTSSTTESSAILNSPASLAATTLDARYGRRLASPSPSRAGSRGGRSGGRRPAVAASSSPSGASSSAGSPLAARASASPAHRRAIGAANRTRRSLFDGNMVDGLSSLRDPDGRDDDGDVHIAMTASGHVGVKRGGHGASVVPHAAATAPLGEIEKNIDLRECAPVASASASASSLSSSSSSSTFGVESHAAQFTPKHRRVVSVSASLSGSSPGGGGGRGHKRTASDTASLFNEFRALSPHDQLYSDRFIPSRMASNLEHAFSGVGGPNENESPHGSPLSAAAAAADGGGGGGGAGSGSGSGNRRGGVGLGRAGGDADGSAGRGRGRSPHLRTMSLSSLEMDEEEDVLMSGSGAAAPQSAYSLLLRSELLRTKSGAPSHGHSSQFSFSGAGSPTGAAAASASASSPAGVGIGNARVSIGGAGNGLRARGNPSTPPPSADGPGSPRRVHSAQQSRTLRFQSPRTPRMPESPYAMSPVGADHQRIVNKPGKVPRKISRLPYKVLDAPNLKDDFYLNLVDWSSQNVLAVALDSSVYLWSACTSKVTKLCDVADDSPNNSVTSVCWSVRGGHLAIGTKMGQVLLYDAAKCAEILCMDHHSLRVGSMSFSTRLLASGGRDKAIYIRDPRAQADTAIMLDSHRQEVCGLKWSPDEQMLASGGNDNKLLVWDAKNCSSDTQPLFRFAEHRAAVKAIAWSPHQHGLLASGGGTADRCIRFWSTVTGQCLNCLDTGSQVCNLMWSRNSNEIVSTHGYSLNQIVVWSYPTMHKAATLTGHTYRVLYLAGSPDGQSIVTGAGDETLRFWNVFPSSKHKSSSSYEMASMHEIR